MKNLATGLLAIIALATLTQANSASALPVCPQPPNAQFIFPHNLFDSAVSGTASLKSTTSCPSLGIISGSRYEMLAEDESFRIYNEDDFFNQKPAILGISVPSQGDYVTTDTCASVTISSNHIVSPSLQLDISESDQGIVTVRHGREHCELHECPKFGACD